MKNDFQDRIDAYLLGRMSEDDKAQFEMEVGQDDSKREQLEFTRNVKSAIGSREDKLARMRMMRGMYDHECLRAEVSMQATGTDGRAYTSVPERQEKKPTRKYWWWTSGIAAIFVICIFVMQVTTLYSPLPMESSTEIFRGGNDDVFDMEMPGIEYYIANDTVPECDSVTVDKEEIDKTHE